MSERYNSKANANAALHGASVDALAARVISVLNSKPNSMNSARKAEVHRLLRELVLSSSGFSVDDALTRLRAMAVGDDDLIDIFIPDVARDLGNGWDASTLSFAQVSMGTARLQSLIPHLEMSHLTLDPSQLSRADSALMLIVCPNDDHTLGPLVFASQLRRMGYSVRLSLGRDLEGLKRQERLSTFTLVLFSCSYSGALPTVSNIVNYLKTLGKARPKMVLGGAVLDQVEGLKKITGVDIVTNDIGVALTALDEHSAKDKRLENKAAE